MLSAWLYSSHVKTLYGCENILRYFRGARTYYNNLGVQAIKKVGNHCSSRNTSKHQTMLAADPNY